VSTTQPHRAAVEPASHCAAEGINEPRLPALPSVPPIRDTVLITFVAGVANELREQELDETTSTGQGEVS